MRTFRAAIACSLPLVFAAALASAQQPAAPPSAAPAQDSHATAKAKPPIYDEKADAAKAIEAALANAAKNNRRVLVQWGANWCPWCHLLHETMASDKNLKHELLYEYDVVLVDTGRFDKNMEIAAKYGADLKGTGIPYLTLLDASGKVLINQETGALESKDKSTPAYDLPVLNKFLKDHEATPRVATDVLADGLSKAKNSGKRVFLHFGAPWCVWCHRLEDWMARPDVAAILGKAFIDVKIDIDRDGGGKDILAKYNADTSSGIPWFAILDESGKALATSTGPKGNIGFPGAEDEISHFLSMIKSSGAKLNAADTDAISKSLKEKPATAH